MTIDRRSVLRWTMLSSAGIALGQPFRQHLDTPHRAIQTYPTDPRSRIAVATYPFRTMIIGPRNSDRSDRVPGMDLAAFARCLRTEFNVSGIEPLHSHFPSMEPSAIVALKSTFDAAGVRTVNIPVDEQVDLCSPDPAVRKAGYAIYGRWVDIAFLLNSPSIRISVPGCGGPKDITGPAAALKPLIAYAAQKNVIVNLENDDPILANEGRIVAILEAVRSPYLRALPDFANSLMGGDEAFNAAAVHGMFAHAANIAHVKDAETITGALRTVSLPELFGIAKQQRFRGFYSMESDSGADPVKDTRHLIEQCLALM